MPGVVVQRITAEFTSMMIIRMIFNIYHRNFHMEDTY